ncbi:MAG TPA: ATP-binding cassette domain-containing protein [Micromonosporaceae bacterium]|nr:ATP-binding cassette domain-containing protein [Micromonosporaceae bacterium]
MANQPVFEVRLASVHFGPVRALTDVDLTIRPGERIVLIGASGAGKSSVLGLLNGTVAATAGRVLVRQHDLASVSARRLRALRRGIGTIHQQFDLVGQLRVVHNVNAGRLGHWPLWKALLSLVSPRDLGPVRQALRRVGIDEKLYDRTENLSGGEQQRVAIARVLVQQPTAILADEPIASLDPTRGREILNLLHDVSAETGTTLVASLHDVDAALDRFTRVIGLRRGRVVFDTAPAALAHSDIDALYALDQGCEPA